MFRQVKLFSIIAIVSGVVVASASAQAQPRHRVHRTVDAYGYVGGGINVLPPTRVSPFVYGLYDDNHSEYGCCGSTRNNERIGLVGAGGPGAR
jgi:hypothetical protein